MRKFKASIKKLEDSALGWKIVDIPFSTKNAYGTSGRVPVHGTVNGFPFRASLFPRKDGKHFLLLNKQVMKGAGATKVGEIVEVELDLDTAPRTVTTPALLKKVLLEEEGLLEYYHSLSYSLRKATADMITRPKSLAARQRQAEKIGVQIYEMKEGEVVPPPILQAVFAHNRMAKIGWEKFSSSRKKGHLWGIFYYTNPETRQKRVEKAVEEMVKHAKKSEKKQR